MIRTWQLFCVPAPKICAFSAPEISSKTAILCSLAGILSDRGLVFAIGKISVLKFVEDLMQHTTWENVYFFAETLTAKCVIWKILFLVQS